MTGLGYTPRHASAVARVMGIIAQRPSEVAGYILATVSHQPMASTWAAIQSASADLSRDACTFSLKGVQPAVLAFAAERVVVYPRLLYEGRACDTLAPASTGSASPTIAALQKKRLLVPVDPTFLETTPTVGRPPITYSLTWAGLLLHTAARIALFESEEFSHCGCPAIVGQLTLTARMWGALVMIGREQSATWTTLVEADVLKSSDANILLARLEQQGYIETVPLDHASKIRPLCLTRAGQYVVMAYWFTRHRELDLPWPFATSPVLFLNGDVER